MPKANHTTYSERYAERLASINAARPVHPIEEAFDRLMHTIKKIGILMVGSSLTKGLFSMAASKFFEMDSFPVKITYADWWPNACQKTKDFATKLWSRRVEGATVTSLATAGLGITYMYSFMHPTATSMWNVARNATRSTLNLVGFQDGLDFGDNVLTLWVLPSLLGTATSLAIGSYDLIAKRFERDRVLETKPIFNPKLQVELDEILSSARTFKEEGSFLQNLLLYGPPGTGKTMVSKWIATNSNMNYILMSGGDLLKAMNMGGAFQTNTGAAVAMLQKLIEHAKSLTSPTLLFIDEAEACFGTRNNPHKSQELISLLNAFLELTGQPTSKLMLVLATNRPHDIDPAVLNRMDYKIHIGPPELNERKEIIAKHLEVLIPSPENRSSFTAPLLDHIAKQTHGFSGRELFKLMNRLKTETLRSPLSPSLIDKVISKFVGQEQQIEFQSNSENPLKSNPFYTGPTPPTSRRWLGC